MAKINKKKIKIKKEKKIKKNKIRNLKRDC